METSKESQATFGQSAVTSGISIVSGTVELKTAACFYDNITIMSYDLFQPSLEEALGPDLEYLIDVGIVRVVPYDEQLTIKADDKAYQYAEAIRSHMAQSLFTPVDEVRPLYEVAGNGMARLYAAMDPGKAARQAITPIVAGRTSSKAFFTDGTYDLDRSPIPSDTDLQELLPVRATATEAVFSLIPVPNHQVPWEDVLAFRAEQNTGLYAARIRLLLERLGKETDRRHVEDLVRSEFASFERNLRVFKKETTLKTFKAWLPWADLAHHLVKSFAILKLSEATKPLVQTRERMIEIERAENKIMEDPFYMIEHIRTKLGMNAA